MTALAIALAACGGTSNNAGSGSSPGAMQTVDLKMMVGGLNKQIYLPNMLAKQLGYFDAEKINITLVDEGSGQGTELEVVAGNRARGRRRKRRRRLGRVQPPRRAQRPGEEDRDHLPVRHRAG